MVSPSGRYIIVYNGEIYNHCEIRTQLPKLDWRGTSDTETLLTAIEMWGLARTVQKIVGMFAFALFDRQTNKLFLVRDRFGEKPLYFGWQGNTFMFASDLNALRPHPSWKPEICQNSVKQYTKFGYVPTPWTIWKDIFKLPPGSLVEINSQTAIHERPEPSFYWQSASQCRGKHSQAPLSDGEAVNLVEDVLRTAINDQMNADVPIGVFLSGGIDSSLVTALMQSLSNNQVNSFSIGFSDNSFNEAHHAKSIARYLGTAHTEYYLSSKEVLDVIPSLPEMYSEPFADSSQIPTYLVSSLAKRDVSVCLSGDAGDELFGGYNRYQWGPRIWAKGQQLPAPLRTYLSGAIKTVSPKFLNTFASFLPSQLAIPAMGDQFHKVASILNCNNLNEVYETLIATDLNSEQVVKRPGTEISWADIQHLHFSNLNPNADPVQNMMFRDTVGFLCDDILTKVDRASMATSLETRIPMLDHRVAKVAWSLPLHMKIRNGQGKWILRQILKKHVSSELIERPKQGFAVPLSEWLRGPLHDWAEESSRYTKYLSKDSWTTKLFNKDGENISLAKEIGKTGSDYLNVPAMVFRAE